MLNEGFFPGQSAKKVLYQPIKLNLTIFLDDLINVDCYHLTLSLFFSVLMKRLYQRLKVVFSG
jgi:hypothetical protein